jgi:colanic acid/amylovoran biosynthesis glycosyltransferase
VNVAYFFVCYPVLSQTFLQREIEGLMRHGIKIQIFTCRQFAPTLRVHTFKISLLFDFLFTLGNILFKQPKLLREFFTLLKKHSWREIRWFFSENFLANAWGVIVGVTFAQTLKRLNIQICHGAWATLPATAAAVSARILGIPFSMGAHAYDIYRDGGDAFLKEKLSSATFTHTTTQANVKYLSSLAPHAKIILARRGLETFPELIVHLIASQSALLLAVGRLIPKKGYSFLLSACKILKERNFSFHLQIIGEGTERKTLERKIQSLNLSSEVELVGALPHNQVVAAYEKVSVFVHAGIIDSSGDRDGLPNVIPEAMARGVPVISSLCEGAQEAVIHEHTGLLADIQNSQHFADAIMRLHQDSVLRERVIHNAYSWAKENFSIEKNTFILAQAFQNAVTTS